MEVLLIDKVSNNFDYEEEDFIDDLYGTMTGSKIIKSSDEDENCKREFISFGRIKNSLSSLSIKLKVTILSLIIISVIGTLTLPSLIQNLRVKSHADDLLPVESVQLLNGLLTMTVNGEVKEINISSDLSNNKIFKFRNLKVYKVISNKIYKSDVNEFYSYSISDNLSAYVNDSGTTLIYSYNTSTEGVDGFNEIKGSKSTCRFTEVDNQYILDFYNPSYSKFDKSKENFLYFNLEGVTSRDFRDGYKYSIPLYENSYQVTIPKVDNVESIVTSVLDSLNDAE